MTRSELDQAYALWRGSSIQEWAKSTLTGPTPSLARSAVPMVKSLSGFPVDRTKPISPARMPTTATQS